jgi:hypothetical protein
VLTIWDDAFCINQDDKDENACQEPLMGDTHVTAKELFFWVGEGDVAFDLLMAYLNTASLTEYCFVDGNLKS